MTKSYIEQLYEVHRELKTELPLCYNVYFGVDKIGRTDMQWNAKIGSLYNDLLDSNRVYMQIDRLHWHINTFGSCLSFTPCKLEGGELHADRGKGSLTAAEFIEFVNTGMIESAGK